ncbi:MAG: FCD domain-containing protein [Candidatus Competibacteraceae bacterium]
MDKGQCVKVQAVDSSADDAVPTEENRRRPKRPDVIAGHIRDLIVEHGLKPGDRLPQEWLRAEKLRASRGTLREAMKILQIEGLIINKTGPGGGTFISALTPNQAILLLGNLFLFQQPSIADIYAIRKLLEPEVAADVAGRISPEGFEALHATIRFYQDEPKNAQEEYEQRLAELDFHVELARHCSNELLGFMCTFLARLLRDTTECRAIYAQHNPQLREAGLGYQVQLLRAIKAGDGGKARQIMRDHMQEAEQYMLERAEIRIIKRKHPHEV